MDPRAADAGDAIADVHAHTTRSDGVLEPAELVRQAAEAGVRLFAIATTTTSPATASCRAGAAPLPAGLELVPAVEINAVTRGLGLELPRASCTCSGIGVDPDDEAFEAALAGQRGARRARFVATRRSACASGHADRRQVDGARPRPRDDALGRPTVARALIAAGFAESVEDAFGGSSATASRGTSRAQGSGRSRRSARSARRAGSPRWRTSRRRRPHLAPARPRRRGAERARDPPPLVRRGDASRGVGAVARALGLVETGGTDYHGDYGPVRGGHAGLVMPEALGRGLRAALGR